MRRTALALVPVIVAPLIATMAGAADVADDVQIGRMGNTLIVTTTDAPLDPALQRRLGQQVTVDFNDAAFDDAIDVLRRHTGENFVIAPAVLQAGHRVTLQAKRMSAANVLGWMARLANVHYGYVDGAVFISDKAVTGPARTRLYDVSDLVMPIPDFPGPELALGGSTGAGGSATGTGFNLFQDAKPADPQKTTVDDIEALLRRHLRR